VVARALDPPWRRQMATKLDYPFQVRPLTDEEGGGYLIEFPDLPGCLSDGETIEAAIANGADALRSWIETARELGDPVPPPRPSDNAYRAAGTCACRDRCIAAWPSAPKRKASA
jgi:predicted RNase H-like HicB family nuclease